LTVELEDLCTEDAFPLAGDIVAAREFGALLTHPGLQIGDQRRAELLSKGPASFRALSVDRPLDLEQLIVSIR